MSSHRYIRYEHHDVMTNVRAGLKGKHRQFCICYDCTKFHPNQKNNCPQANQLYQLCVSHGIVAPIWECPEFQHT